MSEQIFGGLWTVQKLDAIEEYIKAYTTALKHQKFKLCYIDAFAGSGTFKLDENDEDVQIGSALRAMNYPFDKYLFFEQSKTKCNELREQIASLHPNNIHKVAIIQADCNNEILQINKPDWIKANVTSAIGNWIDDSWRGVIFLDPFGMELSWECLIEIRDTKALDLWYLFPLGGVTRHLTKDGQIPEDFKKKIIHVLGNDDLTKTMYTKNPQTNFLDILGDNKDTNLVKGSTSQLAQSIIKRFKEVFAGGVSDTPAIIRRLDKNIPMFLLCFACSNPTKKAQELALRIAEPSLKKFRDEKNVSKNKN